jgi:hypothetical protein
MEEAYTRRKACRSLMEELCNEFSFSLYLVYARSTPSRNSSKFAVSTGLKFFFTYYDWQFKGVVAVGDCGPIS